MPCWTSATRRCRASRSWSASPPRTTATAALNVYVGNGQPLVLQASTTPADHRGEPVQCRAARGVDRDQRRQPHQFADHVRRSGRPAGGAHPGRRPDAQSDRPDRHRASPHTANAQQNAGLDLNGQLGANLFSVGAPQAIASSNNTGTATASVSITQRRRADHQRLFAVLYGRRLQPDQCQPRARRFPSRGTGSSASPITADGLSITLVRHAGQRRSIPNPAHRLGGRLDSACRSPIRRRSPRPAPSRPRRRTATPASATIGSGTVVDPANPNLLATTTIQFTSPTTYSINGAGSYAYTSGRQHHAERLAGADQRNARGRRSVHRAEQCRGTGDNRNALASAAEQTLGVLSNGTISINGATSALVTAVGSQAQQVNTAQTAQTAVNTQATGERPVDFGRGSQRGGRQPACSGSRPIKPPPRHSRSATRRSRPSCRPSTRARRISRSCASPKSRNRPSSSRRSDALESNISTTQNQISSGLAFTTAAQNPAAAGKVDNYNQVLAQSQQYTANANAAQTGLNTEDTALTQVTTQLQSLRDLALRGEFRHRVDPEPERASPPRRSRSSRACCRSPTRRTATATTFSRALPRRRSRSP